MTTAAFQTALVRLIVEPGYRERVREEREAALGEDLEPLEIRRLLAATDDPGLEITRTIHRGFRLSKLLNQLPLTFVLLDRQVQRRELDAFWQVRRPVSFYFLEEALAFCDHLLTRCSAKRPVDLAEILFLEEVVAYERAGLELQRARPAGEEVPLQWIRFLHDPLPLLAELARGTVPAEAESRDCFLVGRKGDGGVEWSLLDADALEQSGSP